MRGGERRCCTQSFDASTGSALRMTGPHRAYGDAQLVAQLGLRPVYDSTWLSRVLARIALTPIFAGGGWPSGLPDHLLVIGIGGIRVVMPHHGTLVCRVSGPSLTGSTCVSA